jgi:multidrug efflux pump subunit AcrB
VIVVSTTDFAGFLPLALSASLLWPPLAIAVLGGLTLSAILVLLAVPAAYVMLFRDPFQGGNTAETRKPQR